MVLEAQLVYELLAAYSVGKYRQRMNQAERTDKILVSLLVPTPRKKDTNNNNTLLVLSKPKEMSSADKQADPLVCTSLKPKYA